ncbi:hypothetical protein Tco_1276138 [Tanacetum coccineum]
MNVMLMVMHSDASTSLSHPPGFTPKTSVTHANVGEICEDGPTNGEDMVNMPRSFWVALRSSTAWDKRLFDFLSNLVRRWNDEAIYGGPLMTSTIDEDLWKVLSRLSAISSLLCLDLTCPESSSYSLREVLSDFGPTPFRSINSWLRMEVLIRWGACVVVFFAFPDSNAMDRLNSKKSTMDNSFGSVEEVDHVRILQSCNGLLLCTEGLNRQLKHDKFNFEDHDHPILTTIEIPHGLHKRMNFLKSFSGNSDDPILKLMEIPHMLQLEGTFFEYLVNTKDFMNPLPEGWSIRSNVWSIGLGEREESSFLVINLSGKVVKYNLISKTINEIFDIGSNQMDDNDDVEFIPPFLIDPNLYEFISSLTSV